MPKGVEYHIPGQAGASCPQCGHFPMRVTNTYNAEGGIRVRRHKCQCGWTGKSTEEV
jgi:transcriptional regulator NrdR family protein